MRQLIIQQVKEQQVQELEDLKSSSTSAEDRTIFIFHFLDDYEDVVNIEEDEKEELIGNIRELLSPCGVIFSISILSSAGEHVAEEGEIEHFVAVTFVKASAAKTAVGVLNGLVIAGQKMVVQLKSTLIADKKLHGDKSVIAEEQQQNAVTATADKKGKNKQASKKEEISSTPSVLIVSNVIHEDEVQDEDEVAEVLNDIYHLASSSTALKQGIASIWIEESTLSTKKSHFNNHVMTQLSPALHPMTLLQVSSLTHVCSIMEALHGKVIAGQMLEAGLVWKSSEESLHWMMKEDVSKLLLVGIVIEDMLDEETAEDPDEVLEVLSNIQDLLQQHASPNVLNLVTKKSICDEKDVIIMFDLKDQTDDFFAIFAEVVTTIDALKQVVIAGVALSVKLLATSSLALSDVLDSQRMSHEELLSLGFVEPLRFDDNLCIGIMHYLTEDDLEDMVGDGAANQEMHEQLMTLKTDLLTLLQQSEAIEVVNSIHSVDFLHPSISSKQDAEGESKDYDIAMLFSDIAIAQQAMIYFDHLLLGGSMLEAMIRQWNPSEDQAKLQERRLPEDTTEVKASVSTAITPYQSIDVNQYASVFKVEYDIDIKALQDQSSAEHSISLPKEKKYHVAKQAPKLRRHGLNDVLFESSIPVSSILNRHYCIN